MKVKMTNYGTTFDLHCPRCGRDEFSEKTYSTSKGKYHKCLHCGADVRSDKHAEIVIVIEPPFKEFTLLTYDEITGPDGTGNDQWKDGCI